MMTLINRIGTLIAEGRTTLYEVEQYAGDKTMLTAWVLEKWKARHREEVEYSRSAAARQDAQLEALRPAIAEMIKRRGGAISPEQEAKIERFISRYRIKTIAEIVEWKKRNGI
jgi:hypothetical protein